MMIIEIIITSNEFVCVCVFMMVIVAEWKQRVVVGWRGCSQLSQGF